MLFKPLSSALAKQTLRRCAVCEDPQSPPVCQAASALVPRHTLPWLPAASTATARADPPLCCTEGSSSSQLLSEEEELKTQARPVWCSPQQTGLAGSTGLGSGAELQTPRVPIPPEQPFLGAGGEGLAGFAVLCVPAPTLPLAKSSPGIL